VPRNRCKTDVVMAIDEARSQQGTREPLDRGARVLRFERVDSADIGNDLTVDGDRVAIGAGHLGCGRAGSNDRAGGR
jgi:hypothetical protein